VLFAYQKKQIEILYLADINVMLKEEEKLLKYRDLAIDFQQIYGMPVCYRDVWVTSKGCPMTIANL